MLWAQRPEGRRDGLVEPLGWRFFEMVIPLDTIRSRPENVWSYQYLDRADQVASMFAPNHLVLIDLWFVEEVMVPCLATLERTGVV